MRASSWSAARTSVRQSAPSVGEAPIRASTSPCCVTAPPPEPNPVTGTGCVPLDRVFARARVYRHDQARLTMMGIVLAVIARGLLLGRGIHLAILLHRIRRQGYGEGRTIEIPELGISLRIPHWWSVET